VTETKKVSKTEYDCECEDFCVPGRSTLCGEEESCDDCGNKKCTKIWQQGCAEIRSRRVLKKSTKEEEVTSYSWVVEEICPACAGACAPSEIILPANEPVPLPPPGPAPQTDATMPSTQGATTQQPSSRSIGMPSKFSNFVPDPSTFGPSTFSSRNR
jgi:hypothetical protein